MTICNALSPSLSRGPYLLLLFLFSPLPPLLLILFSYFIVFSFFIGPASPWVCVCVFVCSCCDSSPRFAVSPRHVSRLCPTGCPPSTPAAGHRPPGPSGTVLRAPQMGPLPPSSLIPLTLSLLSCRLPSTFFLASASYPSCFRISSNITELFLSKSYDDFTDCHSTRSRKSQK
jgi:hypothetical protein